MLRTVLNMLSSWQLLAYASISPNETEATSYLHGPSGRLLAQGSLSSIFDCLLCLKLTDLKGDNEIFISFRFHWDTFESSCVVKNITPISFAATFELGQTGSKIAEMRTVLEAGVWNHSPLCTCSFPPHQHLAYPQGATRRGCFITKGLSLTSVVWWFILLLGPACLWFWMTHHTVSLLSTSNSRS